MDPTTSSFETLKQILRHARYPNRLDDHPWTQSLLVREALANDPGLAQATPGGQLIGALAGLFKEMQPAQPPRAGKRLDPRWGEFGLLAALYFAPFNHGTSFPTSLMEAWCRIDPAILYFVYGKPAEALRTEEIRRYELVGEDLDYGSASTLSDWHRKGLQRFAEVILNRERFLSRNRAQISSLLEPHKRGVPAPADKPEPMPAPRRLSPVLRHSLWLGLTVLLLAALGLGALKARKIYTAGMLVYQDLSGLQELAGRPLEAETLDQALPRLETLGEDLSSFKEEVRPLLWLSPRLGWLPTYGRDLASAPALLDVAEHSLRAAVLSGEALRPLVAEIQSPESSLTPSGAAALFLQSQPQLEEARSELDEALTARETIDVEGLSPRLRGRIVEDLDPLLMLADDGLSLATALPGLVGAGHEGPQTYLLLVQNEDELRPTGGFITAIGNLVLHNGQVISLDFEEAGELEDWSKPYPAAPWQLQQYMHSPVLVLRDSNWYPDFPTAALWAEYLYAYTHSHSVDGVIAFDQHLLVMLLGQLGPLEVEDVPYPITEQNVIEYMRAAKIRPSGQVPQGWYRKEFIAKLAGAILARFEGGDAHDWQGLAQVVLRALEERHLLFQFDDPTVTGLSAKRGWDNAIHAGAGDFLLVTDTNIGFNKTNAVVQVSLAYDVDLMDLAAPEGTLVVMHTNQADPEVPCIHWNQGEITSEPGYPINRCYWNYLRVYKQAGVELLETTPHAVPGDRMILEEPVPARVDDLEEELEGVRGFGTLMVVPGGESLSTSFRFALPPEVLLAQESQAQGGLTYRLTVRKQPGTLAIPLVIRIHLPNRVRLSSIPTGAVVQDNHLLIETDLQRDVEIELVFQLQ